MALTELARFREIVAEMRNLLMDMEEQIQLLETAEASVPETPAPPAPDVDGAVERLGWPLWWCVYPRKTAKVKAEQAWQKLNPDAALVRVMINAVERQKQSEQWQKGIVPHPSTWLNQRRWEDEIPETPGRVTGVDHSGLEAFARGGGE